MRKFSSFLISINGPWDFNENTPNLESVQVHYVNQNVIGYISMKKRITLDECNKLFGNNNAVIVPILSEAQYCEFNQKYDILPDVIKKTKFHNEWFSVK